MLQKYQWIKVTNLRQMNDFDAIFIPCKTRKNTKYFFKIVQKLNDQFNSSSLFLLTETYDIFLTVLLNYDGK